VKTSEVGVETDPVLEALDELVEALRANAARIEATIDRALQMRAERQAGRSYSDIENDEAGPLVVQMARDNLKALTDAGSRLRRAEAAALHAEGMTMDQIAELFGVSRQRVSTLLRQAG
jgi:hypothetical protein